MALQGRGYVNTSPWKIALGVDKVDEKINVKKSVLSFFKKYYQHLKQSMKTTPFRMHIT
jgi:hypothetical protein